MSLLQIPEELKTYPNWVVWKFETRDGKPTKPPFDAKQNGKHAYAATNDATTWASFACATEAADILNGSDYEGPGFVFTDTDFGGGDLDGVVHKDGTIDPFAIAIMKIANSYCEFSPSGTGTHIIFKSVLPLPPGNRKGNKKLGGEIYNKFSPKYFTFTGDRVPGYPSTIRKIDNQDELDLIHFMVMHLHDIKLTRLWTGDSTLWGPGAKYPSQSEADAALCGLLAGMLNKDARKIEMYVSASGLGQREKWRNEPGYRERTIKFAIGNHQPVPANTQQTADTSSARTITLTRGDSVKVRKVPWLWKGRLVAEGLNGFSGEPGCGKSTMGADIIAHVTQGLDFPDGAVNANGPKDVLIICDEDGREDTIVPRLMLAGADMTHVWFMDIEIHKGQTVEQAGTRLDEDLPMIEQKLREHPEIVLVVPDPVTEYFGDANPNSDQEVGPIYSKMLQVSKRCHVAWLLISHFNKDRQATSTYRNSGAKVMVTRPRCNWLFAADPHSTDDRFLMLRGKCNLATHKTMAFYIGTQNVTLDADGESLTLENITHIRWDGETEDKADDVLLAMADPKDHASTKVKAFLDDLLAEGPVRAKAAYDAGLVQRINPDMFKRYGRGISRTQIQTADGTNEWWWARTKLELEDMRTRLENQQPAADTASDDGVLTFLQGMIGDASMPVSILKSAAKARGLNWETVRTAHRRHGYESATNEQGRCWRKILSVDNTPVPEEGEDEHAL